MDVGQEDPSQVFALASVWLLILGFGSSFLIVPLIYTIVQAYQDTFDSGMSYTDQSFELFTMLNGILFMVLGSIIGFPIASASGNVFSFLNLHFSWSRNINSAICNLVLYHVCTPFMNMTFLWFSWCSVVWSSSASNIIENYKHLLVPQ